MLNKPIDDDYFNRLSKMEWDYYDVMLAQDEKELTEKIMNSIEYLAVFIDPEKVKKVYKMKEEKSFNEGVVQLDDGSTVISSGDDKKFSEFAGSLFGEGKAPKFRER